MVKKWEIVMENERFSLSRLETDPYGTNAYFLRCSKSGAAVLVDTPGNADLLAGMVKNSGGEAIILTHGHMDHTLALVELKTEIDLPLLAHAGDSPMYPSKPQRLLADGDKIACGDLTIGVIHSPGHTPGSICLHIGDLLISGDTLFPGGPGKTASPGDFVTIIKSIHDNLLVLPDNTRLFPGHGMDTTIGRERPAIEGFISRGFAPETCGEITWS